MIEAQETDEGYREFYTSLAETWSEEEELYSQAAGRLRYWTLTSILDAYARRGCRMLDAGCGSGIYTIAFVQRGGIATGVDIAPANIRRARQRSNERGLDHACSFVVGKIEKITLPSPVDVVFCSETLEHVLDPQAALLNMDRNLKPEGVLILSTPNKYFVTFAHLLGERIHLPECWERTTYAAMDLRYDGSLAGLLLSFIKGESLRVETKWIVHTTRLRKGVRLPEAQYIHRAYTPNELFGMLPASRYMPIVKRTCVHLWPIAASMIIPPAYTRSLEVMLQNVPVWKNLGAHSLVVARKLRSS